MLSECGLIGPLATSQVIAVVTQWNSIAPGFGSSVTYSLGAESTADFDHCRCFGMRSFVCSITDRSSIFRNLFSSIAQADSSSEGAVSHPLAKEKSVWKDLTIRTEPFGATIVC